MGAAFGAAGCHRVRMTVPSGINDPYGNKNNEQWKDDHLLYLLSTKGTTVGA